MTDRSTLVDQVLVVGANHRSSSLMLRDRLFVEERALPAVLGRLRDAGVHQAVVLSTCDRVEVQAVDDHPEEAMARITGVLANHAEIAPNDMAGQVYTMTGREAVRHIFAVAGSLDSLVIGEPQVLGQVKASHRQSTEAGLTGTGLEAVLQAAYGTAKRVRTETAVGERPVSIASSAEEIARGLHGDLSDCVGLLIGAGDMGELVAEDLIKAGLGTLRVTHPSDSRADGLARRLACHVAGFDDLPALLAESDIVLTSMGARRHVVTADMVQAALAARRHRPVFLVDTGIPGDVDPAVERIDDAFLYDLNDLEKVAMEGRASREAESGAAWRILDQEVDRFLRGQTERAAVPALSRLKSFFEAARTQALADAGDDAEKATHLLVNRLLHAPFESLRRTAAGDRGDDLDEAERLLEQLYDLDGTQKPKDGD